MQVKFIVVIFLVFLAGCSGLSGFPFNENDNLSETTVSPIHSQTPATTTLSSFNANSVRLSLPEVGSGYALSYQSTDSLNASKARDSRFNHPDVVRRYESVFTLKSNASDDDKADIIYSSVVTFQSQSAAEKGAENFLSALPDKNKTVKNIEVSEGLTATRVTFQPAASEYNTLIIKQRWSMIYFVVTSDSEAYEIDQTASLFFEMATDL